MPPLLSRLCLLLLALCPLVARAQSAVHASIDTNQITVGDPVRLRLEASHPPGEVAFVWPKIPDSLGVIEVLERGAIDTIRTPETLTYRQDLLITGYDSGGFYVPSFRFGLEGGSGASYLATDSLPLLIHTVAVDTTRPVRPLKPIIEEPLPWYERPAVILGLVLAALLLLGAGAVVLVRRFRRTSPPPPPPPPLPPHQIALNQLAELEAAQFWQRGEVKAYYVRLTGILRQYLHDRFGLPAEEQTSGELLRSLRNRAEFAAYEADLAVLLHTADAAKFARAQPGPTEHTAALQTAKQFVAATAPAPPPAASSSTTTPPSAPTS